jgi:bacillithiol biosynthesis cysteine-adding enzyme BshC
MNHQKIDYASTNAFSKLVMDYTQHDKKLHPFINYLPQQTEIENIVAQIKSAQKMDRKALVREIEAQYKSFVPNLKVVKNIELLQQENTFTITTAHQLNLFTGPLYYIFKILNTIRVAKDLKQIYPHYNFIPCYWMGSEDHDFEEINHTYLFNKKLEWTNMQGGSLGAYSTAGIEPLIDELKTIIRQGAHLHEIIGIFKRAYTQEKLADAVRVLIDELFGQFGVVTIDGNCAALKQPFQEILKDELEHQTSYNLVGKQIEALEKVGYKSQAAPREINLFFNSENARERIIKTENSYQLADSNQEFSKEELFAIVDIAPEKFSPNVILRPLHQQLVLPNIAYIGGGSEVAYWLQLKTLHQQYNIHFPMLLLRTSAQILSENQLKKLAKLGIETTDIFKETEILKKEFIARQNIFDLELAEEHKTIEQLFSQLSDKASSIDASLKDWIGAEGQKTAKSLESISKRLIKSEKTRNDQSMEQIEKLKEMLFPSGSLQERKENFSPFFATSGNAFFNQLLEVLDPFDMRFSLIEGIG